MRTEIWDLIYELIDERYSHKICQFEGVKYYEDDVKDISDSIAELADKIEQKIIAAGIHNEDREER